MALGSMAFFTWKQRLTLSEKYIVLFCGEKIAMAGGTVPGGGSIGVYWKNGLALPTSIFCISRASENRISETVIAAVNAFLAVNYPLLFLK